MFDEAVAECREAIRLDPDDSVAYSFLGEILAEKGELAEALQTYGESLRLDPDDARILCWYADALNDLGRIDEAKAAWERVVELDNNGKFGELARESLQELEQ